MPLRFAQTNADIQSAFPVVVQRRPHLTEAEFVERIRDLEQAAYKVLLLKDGSEDGNARAVAGFWMISSLTSDIDQAATDSSYMIG